MAMERIEITPWEAIQDFNWHALVLGNGASIALHDEFSYDTLHGVAESQGLLPLAEPIFARLGTTDFEHVLLACWYAENVNAALGSPSADITSAYKEVRNALIEAVHAVHPVHAAISADLVMVAGFASKFQTVVSLNYDLTLYWAMQLFNDAHGSWFKDAFNHGDFQMDWEYLRRPYGRAEGSTLAFYPHGSLSLARNYIGEETKISAAAGTGDLLGAITDSWSSGHYVPIFVSEGQSEEKVSAIRRSRYLTSVFEDVLPGLGENIVVYGWSFDERDQHVLEAISESKPERMAVSVFSALSESEQQIYCHHVLSAVEKFFPSTNLEFFYSGSPGCWNNRK